MGGNPFFMEKNISDPINSTRVIMTIRGGTPNHIVFILRKSVVPSLAPSVSFYQQQIVKISSTVSIHHKRCRLDISKKILSNSSFN